jgi:hypothetical protein
MMAGSQSAVKDAFSNLAQHNFMRVTTYRKSGEAVPTPVWFAQAGDKLYVMTEADAGKVKRIRNNPQVIVEPCTAQGKVLGASALGRARLLSPDESRLANHHLNHKYGFQKRIFDLMLNVRRTERAYIEIAPVSEG